MAPLLSVLCVLFLTTAVVVGEHRKAVLKDLMDILFESKKDTGNGGNRKWRHDLRCGSNYPLSDGSPSECNHHGIYPCCSDEDWCGVTNAHCKCLGCVDYRGQGNKKWRDDLRCGPSYPLSNGNPAKCNVYGIYPCCSTASWCGITPDHCECSGCVDYRVWRDDLRCGSNYPLSDGRSSECDPEGIFPCCSTADWCGVTPAHCECDGCVDYRAWRGDGRCGPNYLLSDGSLSECDPNGIYPCCSGGGWCGSTDAHCDCDGCVDYRVSFGEKRRFP